MADGEDRLFTPRHASGGPHQAIGSPRKPPQLGSSAGPAGPRGSGRGPPASSRLFEDAAGDEDEGGGPAYPHARASLDHPALRPRRAMGVPGAMGPGGGARASPRAAGISRRAIVPVDDDDM
jgi:hypothetical protein